MARTVRTILRVSDVPTSRSMRSSMVALPEKVEDDPVCHHQLAFPLVSLATSPRIAPRPHFRHVIISTLRAGPAFLQD
jgi:hypothetical protein